MITQNDAFRSRGDESSALLDVSGMMCGGCVSRVKSLLSADDRVDSVVVNMLTETAAVKLKPEVAKLDMAANVAERSFWEVLHNSYVKGGLALGALLGPGRGQ
ncbi:copper-transporting atpase paa2 [Quercus suber]|uniref:Copper-transporting atpase paa2 n=1 Tax=Quercus suber TaxID=58331 RepID=A0AAW0KY91_QUESU